MSILVVNVLAVNFWLLSVPSPLLIVSKVSYTLYIVSQSVFYTLCSVKKCLIYPLSVLF